MGDGAKFVDRPQRALALYPRLDAAEEEDGVPEPQDDRTLVALRGRARN